jgi:hypothetical protein
MTGAGCSSGKRNRLRGKQLPAALPASQQSTWFGSAQQPSVEGNGRGKSCICLV